MNRRVFGDFTSRHLWMVDYVGEIVESDNNFAAWAEKPTKFSYRLLRSWQKVEDETGPDKIETRVGKPQRVRIAFFKRQIGEAL
jgi:hypothetical protein